MAAIARPVQFGDARQTSRAAISENAIGMTRSATQTGMPTAITSPAARLLRTSAAPPIARIVEMHAPAAPAMMWPTVLIQPFGRNSPVASERSLPSRAAIAAPSMPTQSVSICANGPAPGRPVPKTLRATISLKGSSITPPIARLATRFSRRTAVSRTTCPGTS